jgi:magnesium chelatase subunit I
VADRPETVRDLRKSGYNVLTVREELRKNLITKLRVGEPIVDGILGYDKTVLPALENALLAGQDVIFLGERGQAKSRLIRSLPSLLDEEIPILDEVEIPEDPYNPVTREGRELIEKYGDKAPIRWLHRDDRYGEKLATPDISIADLIGEVDPIKVAEGRYLADEMTIHFGLVPRSNRGIFCINELPDLSERIQVGLLNLMEERDVQIRGFRVRLPLDVVIVASANPEDYTNRGRIITPLKDRYGAQVRTHYPQDIETEVRIVAQERAPLNLDGVRITMPDYMDEVLAEVTQLARRSPDVNQLSGVSVRATIAAHETLVANAARRAIRLGEEHVVPRVTDLPAIYPAIQGKIELETVDDGGEEQIIEKLVQGGVAAVFNRRFNVTDLEEIVAQFKTGLTVEVGEELPATSYGKFLDEVPGLAAGVSVLAPGGDAALTAGAVEFVLEGLHLNKRLNRDRVGAHTQYRG